MKTRKIKEVMTKMGSMLREEQGALRILNNN